MRDRFPLGSWGAEAELLERRIDALPAAFWPWKWSMRRKLRRARRAMHRAIEQSVVRPLLRAKDPEE